MPPPPSRFKNLDKLIHHVNADGRVNAFYSTPARWAGRPVQPGLRSWACCAHASPHLPAHAEPTTYAALGSEPGPAVCPSARFASRAPRYVAAKHAYGARWPLKEDDFFPYADFPHAFWTGKQGGRGWESSGSKPGDRELQAGCPCSQHIGGCVPMDSA